MPNDKKFIQHSDLSSSSYEIDDNNYKVHKPYDKYFKNLMSIAGEGFMKLIGFPIRIKRFHDSEKVNEISGELHIDKLIESFEPKMYIIEFQKGAISSNDLRRFGSYQVLVFKEIGLETIVIVIGLDAKEDSEELFGFGEFFNKDSKDIDSLKIEYGFTPHVKSLTSMDLSLYLNIIEKIIRNNEKPDGYALAILLSIPFMSDDVEEKKKLIFKTLEFALKLNIDDKDLLIDVLNNQRLIAQTVLDGDEFKQYSEVFEMLSELDLYKLDMYERQVLRKCYLKEGEEKGLKEGEEKGLKEGEEKGVKRVACNMLEKGYSLEEAASVTGLSVDYINKFCDSK